MDKKNCTVSYVREKRLSDWGKTLAWGGGGEREEKRTGEEVES
jgi:hypothetical protein